MSDVACHPPVSTGSAIATPRATQTCRLGTTGEHQGKTFVVVLPDSGERYLSTVLYEGVFDDKGLAK